MNPTTETAKTATTADIDESQYCETRINRTGKRPLWFCGKWPASGGFDDNHNLRREYGIDIYGLKSGTCVALIYKVLEWDNFDVGWGRHDVYISTLTSRSLDELASELQHPDLMTCPATARL